LLELLPKKKQLAYPITARLMPSRFKQSCIKERLANIHRSRNKKDTACVAWERSLSSWVAKYKRHAPMTQQRNMCAACNRTKQVDRGSSKKQFDPWWLPTCGAIACRAVGLAATPQNNFHWHPGVLETKNGRDQGVPLKCTRLRPAGTSSPKASIPALQPGQDLYRRQLLEVLLHLHVLLS